MHPSKAGGCTAARAPVLLRQTRGLSAPRLLCTCSNALPTAKTASLPSSWMICVMCVVLRSCCCCALAHFGCCCYCLRLLQLLLLRLRLLLTCPESMHRCTQALLIPPCELLWHFFSNPTSPLVLAAPIVPGRAAWCFRAAGGGQIQRCALPGCHC